MNYAACGGCTPGASGKVLTHAGGTGPQYLTVHYMGAALDGDGKLLVTGSDGGDVLLMRYTSGGALDTSFNSTGIVTTNPSGDFYGHSIAVQSDGKILVGADEAFTGGSPWEIAVVRYDTDGSVDTSFGSGGSVVREFASGPSFLGGIAIQSDGHIMVGGVGYMTVGTSSTWR